MVAPRMKKPVVFVPVLAALLIAKPAGATAIFGGGKPILIQEDYVFLHHDDATKRVHLLYAARVAPAFVRVQMGLPTPSTPTLEQLTIDLPESLHKLIAPHEMRLHKRPPAPPPPWIPTSTRFDSFIESASSADHVFDADWTKSYVDKGFSIAVAAVTTPDDQRLEVLSPTIHISYVSERLGLARREPPLPIKMDDELEPDGPEKPRPPFTITVSKVEPKQKGLTVESMSSVWGNPPGALQTCHEAFLEKKPNASTTVNFLATMRPKGDIVAFEILEATKDPADKELGSCIEKVLRAKQLPSTSEGYEVTARIDFTPPRVPARRTHIVTIGSAKYVWRSMPASVRVEQDFEILPQDLVLAMSAEVRKALNLRNDERVWVTHWLDRSTRRTSAEDIEFERQVLPARGKPGALEPEVHDADLDRARPKKVLTSQTTSRKRRNVWAVLSIVIVSLLAALGIAWREMRG